MQEWWQGRNPFQRQYGKQYRRLLGRLYTVKKVSDILAKDGKTKTCSYSVGWNKKGCCRPGRVQATRGIIAESIE
jgi:hypothetical protein